MDMKKMNQLARTPRKAQLNDKAPVLVRQSARPKIELGPLPALLVKMFRRGVKFGGGAKPERRMRMVEQLAVGGKRSLAIVAVDGREYLIGGNTETISVIAPLAADLQLMPVLNAEPRIAGRAW